jgi:hypothetical protein
MSKRWPFPIAATAEFNKYRFPTSNTTMNKSQRICNHPILTTFPKGGAVAFEFDGQVLAGYEDEPIAVALRANGVMVHRYTVRDQSPRGIFCAIGRCTDCVMVVDGKPNVRTCVTPLHAGMKVQTQCGLNANQNPDGAP